LICKGVSSYLKDILIFERHSVRWLRIDENRAAGFKPNSTASEFEFRVDGQDARVFEQVDVVGLPASYQAGRLVQDELFSG
jgi:hypothetical protein